MKLTYHIITYGCQMNTADSGELVRPFKHRGFLSRSRRRQCLAVVLAASCLASPLRVVADAVDLSRNVRVYVYRPGVFADRYLGPRIPNLTAVQATLWYARVEDSVRARAGAQGLGQFVRTYRIPGLDLTGNRTFTDGDLETMAHVLQQPGADPAWKFRLLRLRGTQTTDRALATIGRLFDLLVLDVGEKVTDQGVQRLQSLKQLRVLNIPSAQVTDASLETLSQLPRLQRLSLQNTQITDKGLAKLKNLPLRQLDLGSRVTDAGLEQLGGMQTLEQLDLHQAQVSAKGLAALANLPRIHTLLLGPSITDADLPALLAFKNLQRLDLTGARVSDAGLNTLAKMTSLKELALTQSNVSDAAWKSLGALPQLRYLEVSQTRVTAKAFKELKGFPALQVVSFSTTQRLTPEDIRPLARLTQLHTILINGHPLGRPLVNYLREQAGTLSSWWDWLVPDAHAAGVSERDLDKALEVANLASAPTEPGAPPVRGLHMIHEAESSLDEVISAPSMVNVDNQQDTESNFMGEFVIEAGKVKKKKP